MLNGSDSISVAVLLFAARLQRATHKSKETKHEECEFLCAAGSHLLHLLLVVVRGRIFLVLKMLVQRRMCCQCQSLPHLNNGNPHLAA